MPTENRSSNTEMVSVPRDEVERLVKLLAYQAHPYPSPHAEYWQSVLDQPVQHQGEPVAVLYANGTVLTKADCGDVFDICCKVETPLYTHSDPSEVERLREDLSKYIARANDFAAKMQGAQSEAGTLRAQLAELVSAVRSINYGSAHAVQVQGDDEPCYPQRKEWIEWLLGLCEAANAEPSAPKYHRQSLGMDDAVRERLTLIAREAAISCTHRYNYMLTTPEDALLWEPHAWVLGAMRMVELSAPVEIDERAEFEKAVIDKAERFHPELRQYGEQPDAEYRDANIEWAWGLWQARAALERKPQVKS
ncbi:hypothetical protein [Pseudomonas promysalinigenes]|uniref:Uncharacterized protein n=1 Tax=Pseudomonas promysalinigenes TaxID=485898 RepID=A0ABY6APJ1_9PSED|nr:hypothetical protein [Pseudomonas promysalinigenes]UXH41569.1 hypothetical protein N5C08_08620 [Pseudomonas promysalinigenes]